MSIRFLYILFLCCAASQLSAQEAEDFIRKGNESYKSGDYKNAEVEYKRAESNKELDYITSFNQGDALYKMERYEEAQTAFEKAIKSTGDKKEQANAHYNLGNTYLSQQKPSEAVNSYKEALKLNPKDAQARYNLSLAKQMLQQQQQQSDQNQDGDQDQDQKQQQQDEGDKGEEEQKDKGEQQQQDEGDKGEEEQKEQQQQTGERKENEIGKEEAEKLLEAVKRDEQKLHDKKKQKVSSRAKSLKDW
jgi:tetratricopeptide (TPR) repeat protein